MRVLQLYQYQAVIFFDSDLMFVTNIDHLFKTKHNFVGSLGHYGPLNAGFFVAHPSPQSFLDIYDIASSKSFGPRGWFEYGPIEPWLAIDKAYRDSWTFYGRTVDQGLLYYYFFCIHKDNYMLTDLDGSLLFQHYMGDNRKPAKYVLQPNPEMKPTFWLRYFTVVHQRLSKLGFSLAYGEAINTTPDNGQPDLVILSTLLSLHTFFLSTHTSSTHILPLDTYFLSTHSS